MTTERGLLQEILAHPEDDSPRLVYADWLEEHGGEAECARSAFIRSQIEHARLPPDHPRRRELAEREGAMLLQHGAAWRAGLPAWTRKEAMWFRRGFAVQVSAGERGFVRGAAALRRVAPLEGVHLLKPTNRFSDVLPHLAGLPHLRVSGALPEHLDALAAGAAALRTLGLGYSVTDDTRLRALLGLLRSPHVGPLQELHLSGVSREDVLHALPATPHASSLRALAFNPSGQMVLTAAATPSLTGLPHLEALTLGWVEGGGLAELLASPAVRPLQALQLSPSLRSRSADHVAALARSPHLRGLAALTLERGLLTVPDVETLAASPNLAGVFHLSLRGTHLTDAAVKALAASPVLDNVVILNLCDNWLRKGAALALARSPHLTSLRELLVGSNHLDAESLALLRERFTVVNTGTHWAVSEGYNDFRRSDLRGVAMASLA